MSESGWEATGCLGTQDCANSLQPWEGERLELELQWPGLLSGGRGVSQC